MKRTFLPPGYVMHTLPGDVAILPQPRPVCAGCGKALARSVRPHLASGYAEPGETDVAAAQRIAAKLSRETPPIPVTRVEAHDDTSGRRWITAWGAYRWHFEYGHFHSLRCAHAYAERALAKSKEG